MADLPPPTEMQEAPLMDSNPGGESAPRAEAAAGGGVLRLDELEKQAVLTALKQTGGNRTQAAAVLGISIRTLRNKLQEYRDAGEAVEVDVDAMDA
jgi:DNA-binding NtrC family response regulator